MSGKPPPQGIKECEMCGAKKSAQWRRGSDGELSLCNRCGLRIKRKKRAFNDDDTSCDIKREEKEYVQVKLTRQMKRAMDFYQNMEHVSAWVDFLVTVEENLLE